MLGGSLFGEGSSTGLQRLYHGEPGSYPGSWGAPVCTVPTAPAVGGQGGLEKGIQAAWLP